MRSLDHFTLYDKDAHTVCSLADVVEACSRANKDIYLFGGASRAWSSGAESPNDFDLCISGALEDFLDVLRNTLNFTPAIDFVNYTLGMASCGFKGGISCDFNIFRTRHSMARYINAREKVLHGSDLAAHAATVDFSLNAIFINLKTGEYFDPCQGVADAQNRILRFIKDPGLITQSYNNALRIIKFINRGYDALPETLAILEERIDIELQKFGVDKTTRWLYFQLVPKGDNLQNFEKIAHSFAHAASTKEILTAAFSAVHQHIHAGTTPKGGQQ